MRIVVWITKAKFARGRAGNNEQTWCRSWWGNVRRSTYPLCADMREREHIGPRFSRFVALPKSWSLPRCGRIYGSRNRASAQTPSTCCTRLDFDSETRKSRATRPGARSPSPEWRAGCRAACGCVPAPPASACSRRGESFADRHAPLHGGALADLLEPALEVLELLDVLALRLAN